MNSALAKRSFWRAFKILLLNFHAINRRYFATVITAVEELQDGLEYDRLPPNAREPRDTVNSIPCSEEYLTETLNNFKGHLTSGLQGLEISFDLLSRKIGEGTIKACAYAGNRILLLVYFLHCLTTSNTIHSLCLGAL